MLNLINSGIAAVFARSNGPALFDAADSARILAGYIIFSNLHRRRSSYSLQMDILFSFAILYTVPALQFFSCLLPLTISLHVV